MSDAVAVQRLIPLLLLLLAACDGLPVESREPAVGPFTASIAAGDDQVGRVAEPLAEPVRIEVEGANGRPAAGLSIVWRAQDPAGTATAVGTATTDAEGRAAHDWVLGERAGAYQLRALLVDGSDTLALVDASATARAGAPVTGQLQGPPILELAVGDTLRPSVLVSDTYGNMVPGHELEWASSQPLVATLDSGVVHAHLDGVATLRSIAGEDTLRLDVVVPGTEPAPLLHIAFGSCSRQDLPQPLWSPILDSRPDLWIWLGDNIYGDTEDMSLLAAKYAQLKGHPGYVQLLGQVPVVGTWDDHDYGRNNAGREYPMRAESQQLFLDFFDVPDTDPRRDIEGVYSAHTFGPAGQRVKVILLDVRYHREYPGATADILGETQWAWLERELRESDAQINLIGSGIQIVAQDHIYEKWAAFPAARERLFQVIGESGAAGVLLLSGDRHIGEISRVDETAAGQPLYDVTSSGLTHSWTTAPEEYNRHRVAGIMRELHYGLLRIDWRAGTVALELRDAQNQVSFERVVQLSTLNAASGS